MKLSKSGEGGVRIRLDLVETSVVGALFDELERILSSDDAMTDDPVQQRLYPAAYAEPDAACAYRDLTESALRADRIERLETCRAEVRAGRSIRRTEIVLDAEGAERWLRVLNDLRLAFGTQLGITEDDSYVLDRDDPDAEARARYLWLTALQDGLVTALLG